MKMIDKKHKSLEPLDELNKNDDFITVHNDTDMDLTVPILPEAEVAYDDE